jgi:4-amino-4-deoxy-L-arabinose transferase-like glycosyltransferase
VSRPAKDSFVFPVLLGLLAFSILLRASSFHFSSLDDDEGIYLLMGRFLLQGHLPYLHFWDHQAPLIFFISATAQLLPVDDILAVRFAGALFVAATGFALYRIGRRLTGARVAGVAGAFFYCYAASVARWGGLAFNNEIVFNAFAAFSLEGILSRLESRRVRARSYAVAGLWIGLAFLTKMHALFDFVPFCLLILFFGRGDRSLRYRIKCLAVYSLGAAVPHGTMMGIYLAAGSLSEYVHANWIANLGYIAEERVFRVNLYYNLKRLAGFAWMAPVWLFAVFAPAGRGKRVDGNCFAGHARFRAFMAVWIVTVAWSTTLSKTFYVHYFLQLFPALSLLTGIAAWRAGGFHPAWRRRFGRGAVFTLLAVFVLKTGGLEQSAAVPRGTDPVKRAAHWIRRNKSRGDTLYVSDGDIVMYHLCGMDIPTRFAFPIQLNRKKYGPMYEKDQKKELERILAARPTWIVAETGVDSAYRDFEDPEMKMVFETALKRRYNEVKSIRANVNRVIRIYRVRDSRTASPEGFSSRNA